MAEGYQHGDETAANTGPLTSSAKEQTGILHVRARDIPLPATISPQARAFLTAQIAAPRPGLALPALEDHAAWRALFAQRNAYLLNLMRDRLGIPENVKKGTLGGVTVYEATPAPASLRGGGVIVYLHGGAMVLGSGELGLYWAEQQMRMSGRRVIAVDFGNPPDYPYPAALDDCVAVYLELLKAEAPSDIAIMGASGGGNLALGLAMRLVHLGHPLPAAIALQSPEADITEAGDSFQVLMGVDTQLTESLIPLSRLYAGGHDMANPELSPLYADFPPNFPPTWIQSGTRDLFLSNAVLLHRALRRQGVEAELHLWEAMPHAGFGANTPEERDMTEELTRFMAKYLCRH